MRKIESHKVEGQSLDLDIHATDEPGPGGANHDYLVSDPQGGFAVEIKFQKHGVAEAGINGVSNEALLAIVLDRLTGFQNGPYPSIENERAMAKVEAAMDRLKDRTRERLSRGVEGKVTQ